MFAVTEPLAVSRLRTVRASSLIPRELSAPAGPVGDIVGN